MGASKRLAASEGATSETAHGLFIHELVAVGGAVLVANERRYRQLLRRGNEAGGLIRGVELGCVGVGHLGSCLFW